MRVLVVGGGGREHAIAWKAAQSPEVDRVYVAPGNAGTRREPGVENVGIGAEEIAALVDFARDHAVGLTIIGPEKPLVMGVVDRFREAGLACFGPSRRAAELEGSKTFAKAFLERHAIATASYRAFSELEAAQAYIRERGAPLVVKADGLAAGKGVVVAHSVARGLEAAASTLGAGAGRIVVEDFLEGEEVSFMAMVAGDAVLPLATSQDHKALNDGDRGPNTGGMGAYSPAPIVTPHLRARILEEIVHPTLRGLREEERSFSGFLYAGLMIAPDGTPRVLEFNVRLGDPEAQPLLMRMAADLPALCAAACRDRLADCRLDWDPRVALGVVVAAKGYPGAYERGDTIHGLATSASDAVKVFHAGTREDDAGNVVTSGGRVLCVCALGETTAAAQERAYQAVAGIRWAGMHYRTDIGHSAVRGRQADGDLA